MSKTYLRYQLREAFGVISGSPSASSVMAVYNNGKTVLSACLENINIWNLKQGSLEASLTEVGNTAQVSSICMSPDTKRAILAAGYTDGKIRVWDLTEKTVLLTLTGHKTAVSSLRYNSNGSLLASGSADTNVIVWDCVAESGLYRLHGHKNKVTDLVFFTTSTCNFLITASMDTHVKVWDLETQHCVQTLTGHRGEVWSLDICLSSLLLVTGSTDKQLRIWELDPEGDEEGVARYLGDVERNTNKRALSVRFDRAGMVLGVLSADKTCDFFRVRNDEEVKKKIKRRLKRLKEKAGKNKLKSEQESDNTASLEQSGKVLASDKLETLLPLRRKEKITGFSFVELDKRKRKKGHQIGVAITLNDNTISMVNISGEALSKTNSTKTGSEEITSLALPGHRSGVRSLSLSQHGNLLLSTDSSQLKVWNVSSAACVRTLDTGYGLCGLFVPGDRYIVLGTRAGHLELWELGSGTIVEKIQAHDGPVWSLDILPDKKGFVSGGGDKEVKVWDFEISLEAGSKAKQLNLVQARSLKTGEEVLCVKCSPDGRYLALGMLDSTIKVFYLDSFKFFLSLYGHKLPVLTLDISSDSTLLVSGSADKNVKLWGLDFGDCHKSLFAHDDSVMKTVFVNKTHYFFTAGKDKAIKFWDGDRFEHVLTLQGHHAECWGLVVSPSGDTVVSSGNDKSIRIWEQTDEQVFPDEEREERLEEQFEEGAQVESKSIGDIEGAGVETEGESSAVARGKAGRDTLKFGEKLMEALDLAEVEEKKLSLWEEAIEERNRNKQRRGKKGQKRGVDALFEDDQDQFQLEAPAKPVPSRLMMGRSPAKHVLHVLKCVPTSDLDECLMVLHFNYVPKLVTFLGRFVEQGVSVELCVRCILFLLNLHQKQIIANQILVEPLSALKKSAKAKLKKEKDALGFNLAALKFLDATITSDSTAFFFGDPKFKRKKPAEKRKTKKFKKPEDDPDNRIVYK